MRFLNRTAVLALVLFPLSGAAQTDPTPTEAEPLHSRFGEYGWIETEIRQVRPPNDQALLVRGKLHNPYEQPIDGVRLVVRLLARGSKRELDRLEQEIDVHIPPGGTVPLNRELTTGYSKRFGEIAVVAFAQRRGDSDLPEVPAEVVDQAGAAQEIFFAGDVPYPSAPVGIGQGAF